MKISYRNQAVLKMLNSGILGPIAIHSQDKYELTDELLSEFGKIWQEYSKLFNENVRVLSTPFAKAVTQSADKLASGDLLKEVFLQNTSGTLIINDRTICYSFENIDGNLSNLTYFYFQKNSSDASELRCFMRINLHNEKSSANTQTYISKSGIYKESPKLSIEIYTKLLVSTLNFINYADIEVKLLPANKKVKDFNCKYVNDTSSNIQYLNSTWFTTLIKSDSFKVRGHFRLQPKKKDGELTKELIWIKEYEKKGYVSKAKKLES